MTEPLPNFGRFLAGRFSFEVDDGLTLVALTESETINEQELDKRFPKGVPSASWLLARLRQLAEGSLDLDENAVEVCEGGVYVIDFLVRKDGSPAGKVQVQAGLDGAGLLGVVAPDQADVVNAFIDALLDQPQSLAPCKVNVRDPSWTEGRVETFGYDGERLL